MCVLFRHLFSLLTHGKNPYFRASPWNGAARAAEAARFHGRLRRGYKCPLSLGGSPAEQQERAGLNGGCPNDVFFGWCWNDLNLLSRPLQFFFRNFGCSDGWSACEMHWNTCGIDPPVTTFVVHYACKVLTQSICMGCRIYYLKTNLNWGFQLAKPRTRSVLTFEVSCRVLCERQDDVEILHGLCQVGGGNAPLDSATSLANHTALAGNLPILVQGLPQLRQLNFKPALVSAALLCDQGRAIHEDEAFECVNQRGYVAMACGRTIFQWQQLRFN